MAEDTGDLLRQFEDLVDELAPEDRLSLVARLAQPERSPSAALNRGAEETLLAAAQRALGVRHDFQTGQLVEWKLMLRNRQLPLYGQPAIVLEVLPEPVYDESEFSDSPYFREPLDLVLGVIDGEGDIAAFHFDARRFKPLDPEDASE